MPATWVPWPKLSNTRSSSRLSVRHREVGGYGEPRLSSPRGPAEGLPRHQVIVHRPLAGQRAVAVGIGEDHPAVAGPGDDDRERVAHLAVAVQIGCRGASPAGARRYAAVVGPCGVERGHPAESGQLPARDLDRVSHGRNPPERHCALVREIAQVEHLRRVGRGLSSDRELRDRRRYRECRSARRGRRSWDGAAGTRSTPVLASGIQPCANAASGGTTGWRESYGSGSGVTRRRATRGEAVPDRCSAWAAGRSGAGCSCSGCFGAHASPSASDGKRETPRHAAPNGQLPRRAAGERTDPGGGRHSWQRSSGRTRAGPGSPRG